MGRATVVTFRDFEDKENGKDQNCSKVSSVEDPEHTKVGLAPHLVFTTPSFKISPPPCCPKSSPVIAPLDDDPAAHPYDPKTNYLSSRPQFLHYRPNPRIEYYLSKEREGKRLEDNFISGSSSAIHPSAFSLQPLSHRPSAPSIIRRVRCLHIPPNDSESAFSLRPSSLRPSSLRPSAPSIIRRVQCLHIPSMIGNRPSAFGHQPSAIQPSAPSIIRRVRCLHIPPMIRNRPSAFGIQPLAIQPSAIHPSAFSLRPFNLRPSAPSIIRRVRCLHIPQMIRNRPSAFGHPAFGHSTFGVQPSAIGTFHHSARAMSSHPPNDSESAFSHRPSSLRPSAPFIIRRVRCLHIPPMIRNRPSAFGHPAFDHSAFGHSAFGHRHLPSFGACDVFTSPQ
ncbi:unnamed protein product [Prunus armeniaca]